MQSEKRGFTFIEIIMTILIISILAVIALPRYIEFRIDAKTSRVKANLGIVRTGIENYRLESIVKSGINKYPQWNEVNESSNNAQDSKIMTNGDIPDNPFSSTTKFNKRKDYVYRVTTEPKGTLVQGGRDGWCYREKESSPGAGDAGQFWANTNTSGVNENKF